MPEIAIDCGAQYLLVHSDDIEKAREPIAPCREGWIALPRESGALQLENAAQLFRRSRADTLPK